MLTEVEFLANSFSKDSLSNIAAHAQAQGSCYILLQTKPAASPASNREPVTCIRPGKPWSTPPQGCCGASLPSIAAAFPLHQGSSASFGPSLARSPQPLEAACRRLRESLHGCVQRKLSCSGTGLVLSSLFASDAQLKILLEAFETSISRLLFGLFQTLEQQFVLYREGQNPPVQERYTWAMSSGSDLAPSLMLQGQNTFSRKNEMGD